jgi:hypothetical protein
MYHFELDKTIEERQKVLYKCLNDKTHNKFQNIGVNQTEYEAVITMDKFGNIIKHFDPNIYRYYYRCIECGTEYVRIEHPIHTVFKEEKYVSSY